jgi:hypothetical protein
MNFKIYHIVHVDKLPSIMSTGALLSDAKLYKVMEMGTNIGMEKIKQRRLQITFSSYRDMHVGDCVPFYFCPRSVMLYILSQKNHPEIDYKGGQEPIIHLVANFKRVIDWAGKNSKRWVFTDSNAGSHHFNDYNDTKYLSMIDWKAVHAKYWIDCREKKQAEFLIEDKLPWKLIESIGVYSKQYYNEVISLLSSQSHQPITRIKTDWYY